MFVSPIRAYLNPIRPWCQNEWSRDSFADPAVATAMSDPGRVVFPIPTRPYPGIIEQFFLGRKRTDVFLVVNGSQARMELTINA